MGRSGRNAYMMEIDVGLLTYHGCELPTINDFIVEVGEGECRLFSDLIAECSDHQ